MSFEHIKWAWNADKGLNSSEQLVLLALADRANKSGVCWPSIPTISDDTHLNRKTVIRCINVLEYRGLVVIAKTHGDSNRYQLQKPPADIQPILDCTEGAPIVVNGVVPNLPGVVPKTAPKPIINQSTSKTTTSVEPVQVVDASMVTAKPDVVVERDLIDEKETPQTKTTANADTGPGQPIDGIVLNRSDCQNDHGCIGSVPGIDTRHQKVARKALERLTKEEADSVVTALTLALSKGTVSNPVGYLLQLVKASKAGTFSHVQATGAAPAPTLEARIAKEREKEREAATRGKMSNAEWFRMMNAKFGDRIKMPNLEGGLKTGQ